MYRGRGGQLEVWLCICRQLTDDLRGLVVIRLGLPMGVWLDVCRNSRLEVWAFRLDIDMYDQQVDVVDDDVSSH